MVFLEKLNEGGKALLYHAINMQTCEILCVNVYKAHDMAIEAENEASCKLYY
jgi:hypothetical protein